ncbi:MAG: NRDE family protein [Verrucomicrobiota bacterium]
MCTVTWWESEEGYEVFFNRDELKDRPEALFPSLARQSSLRYLAPTDPAAGGTWILVNEHGLSLCLLNLYESEIHPASSPTPTRLFHSRGLLLRSLAGHETLETLTETLKRGMQVPYNAFTLLAFQKKESFRAVAWEYTPDQELSGPRIARRPISSSSFATETVLAKRRADYDRRFPSTPSPEGLRAYHHSHGAESTAYTVQMNRPDAQTWAFNHLRITSRFVSLHHEAFPRGGDGPSTFATATLPFARL